LVEIQYRIHNPLMAWFCREFDVQLNLPKNFRIHQPHDTIQKNPVALIWN